MPYCHTSAPVVRVDRDHAVVVVVVGREHAARQQFGQRGVVEHPRAGCSPVAVEDRALAVELEDLPWRGVVGDQVPVRAKLLRVGRVADRKLDCPHQLSGRGRASSAASSPTYAWPRWRRPPPVIRHVERGRDVGVDPAANDGVAFPCTHQDTPVTSSPPARNPASRPPARPTHQYRSYTPICPGGALRRHMIYPSSCPKPYAFRSACWCELILQRHLWLVRDRAAYAYRAGSRRA